MSVMAFLISFLIGLALASPVLVALWRKPWREHANSQFAVQRPPADIQQRIEQFAVARRGWKVKSASVGRVEITCRLNWASWRKQIDIMIWQLSPTQTVLELTARSPQLFDWGDGARAINRIRAAVEPR